jgi:radical SAM protein with 4Fe4S-binding SPASM domain
MDKTSSNIKRQKQVLSSVADDYYFTYLANPGSQVFDIRSHMYMKRPAGKKPCRLLWRTMAIDFNGNASACCLDFDQQLITGNVLEHNLSAIWTSNIYRHYRELHRKKQLGKMPLCGACNKDINSPKSLFSLNLRIKLNLI